MYPYIDVFGRSIPSYGLCMALGIIVSCVIGFARAYRLKLDMNSLIIIAACAVGFGLFGAKLLYIVVSCDIKEVINRLLHGDIQDLAGGGQVFYGGLFGGIAGAFLGVRIAGITDDTALYCESILPVIPLGHAFGRIGCFLGGCCYGASYTGIGAVTFPKVGVLQPVFPVQLVEAVCNVFIFAILFFRWDRKKRGYAALYLYMILYSTVRFLLEFFRGDEIRGIAQGLSTSQWISVGLFAAGCIFLVINVKRRKNVGNAHKYADN